MYPENVKALSDLSARDREALEDDLGFALETLTLAELNWVLQSKNEIAQIWEEQMEWERNQYCTPDF
jgi:hypothetical protein